MIGRGIERGGELPKWGMSMARRYPFALTVLVVVLIGAGCSGEEERYVDEANAICAPVVADSRALLREIGPGRAERDQALRRLVSERGRALVELQTLRPPAGKRGEVERMLTHFEASQRRLHQGERIEGERSLGLLLMAAKKGEKAHAIARGLGLDDCAAL